ncbi:hypothetical protein FRC01_009640 [Tulasnella sp. 417]|nr:hypothetical protein FRC01_009640 [Tulasnella sp. 417]
MTQRASVENDDLFCSRSTPGVSGEGPTVSPPSQQQQQQQEDENEDPDENDERGTPPNAVHGSGDSEEAIVPVTSYPPSLTLITVGAPRGNSSSGTRRVTSPPQALDPTTPLPADSSLDGALYLEARLHNDRATRGSLYDSIRTMARIHPWASLVAVFSILGSIATMISTFFDVKGYYERNRSK